MKAVGYYQSLPIDHPDALLDLELPEPTPGPRDLARSACSVLAIGSGTPGTSPAPVATASCIGSTSALPGTCRKASTSPRPRPCR